MCSACVFSRVTTDQVFQLIKIGL